VVERWRDGGGRWRRKASCRVGARARESLRAEGGGVVWPGVEAPLFLGAERHRGGGC
jgi:hypothetical protein